MMWPYYSESESITFRIFESVWRVSGCTREIVFLTSSDCDSSAYEAFLDAFLLDRRVRPARVRKKVELLLNFQSNKKWTLPPSVIITLLSSSALSRFACNSRRIILHFATVGSPCIPFWAKILRNNAHLWSDDLIPSNNFW